MSGRANRPGKLNAIKNACPPSLMTLVNDAFAMYQSALELEGHTRVVKDKRSRIQLV